MTPGILRLPVRRYVAIGDSSTEGLDDPDGAGGYRGWADRLADRLARDRGTEGELLYANLAIRGRRTRQIRDEQLAPALAMEPDFVTLFSGTNDVIGRRCDLASVLADVAAMHRAIRAAGATLLTFTLPDLAPVLPVARRLSPRVAAMNAGLRQVCTQSGAILVDLAGHPVACDPRLWSGDRLHANAAGHARIAAALAEALGLPGTDASWSEPLPPLPAVPRRHRLRTEAEWTCRYLVPWLWRHLLGRSSGDGRLPKRPCLLPVRAQGPAPELPATSQPARLAPAS